MNKALLVGINAYKGGHALDGCVNDVRDMEDFLLSICQFPKESIKVLSDTDATKEAMLKGLGWLLENLAPGDRILFHFSGHGAQFPTIDPDHKKGQLDEVILPYDYNFGSDKSIHDKEFHAMFSNIPKGVTFFWVSDSCHSGDLFEAKSGGEPRKVRMMPMTLETEKMIRKVKEMGAKPVRLAGAANKLNLVLLSACRQDQLADDGRFEGGRANGVLTYFLLRELKKEGALKKTFAELFENLRKHLPGGKFDQEPQLEGAEEVKNIVFLNL